MTKEHYSKTKKDQDLKLLAGSGCLKTTPSDKRKLILKYELHKPNYKQTDRVANNIEDSTYFFENFYEYFFLTNYYRAQDLPLKKLGVPVF